MNKLADNALTLGHTKPLIERFKFIKEALAELEAVKDDLGRVDKSFQP